MFASKKRIMPEQGKAKVTRREQEEEATCSICLDTIGQTNCTTTECGHKFHTTCYMDWLFSKTTSLYRKTMKSKHDQKMDLKCPNCRNHLVSHQAKYTCSSNAKAERREVRAAIIQPEPRPPPVEQPRRTNTTSSSIQIPRPPTESTLTATFMKRYYPDLFQ